MNTLPVDENYLKHYHLSHDPFAARVPNFKFFPAQRKTILGQLHHLARHSTLMLVVTGPENSGKTLLRQALIASVNKGSVKIINTSVTDCQNTAELLALLVNELQASSKDLRDIIAQINKLKEQGVDLYLMIDDADQLTEDALQTLFNLAAEQLTGLHIFLFSRARLLERIENSNLAKEVTFNLPLTPYSLDETAEYLTSRLDGAGQKLALFTEAEINTIYTKSGGWPGTINQIAKDILLSRMEQKSESKISATSFSADFDDEQKVEPTLFALDDEDEFEEDKQVKSKFKLPKKHLAIVVIIAIILILILLFSNSSKTGQKTDNAENVQSVDLSNNTTTQTVSIPLGNNEQSPATNTDTPSTQPQPDIPLQVNAKPDTDSTGKPIATTQQNPVPATDAPVATAPLPTTEPVTVEAPKEEPPKANVQQTSVVTKKEEPAKTKPIVAKTTGNNGNSWYQGQTNTHFTIQVSVASSERLAKDFLKKHAGNYQYFKRSRAGRIDYVITSGSYSNRTAAQNAIKTLPSAVQSSKPWVRSFASIKQELAK